VLTSLPSHAIFPLLKTSFAAFGGILFGYDTGTISGLQQMPDWLRTFGHQVPVSSTFPDGYGISSNQRSLVVSILSAGTFFGPFYHPAIFCPHLIYFIQAPWLPLPSLITLAVNGALF
jgi:hypothetical protein